MKTVLLIAAFSVCVWPTGAFATGPLTLGDKSRQPAAVSQPADASSAKSKAFIHPDTGEILSREQWEQLGIENEGVDADLSSSVEASRPHDPPVVLQGRQVDLGNGDYVIIVDAPEEEMVETKAWFDEEGKAHIRCNH